MYLDQFLPEWLAREPDNPYLAVFAPLVLRAEPELRQQAPRLWQTIQQAPLEPDTREALGEILAFWMFERFKSLTKKEIWTMLQVLTPLEQTRAYQEIFAEGRADGEARGRAESLKRLLTRHFGPLPNAVMHRINAASVEQLDVWFDRALDAKSLASVLDDRKH